MEEQVKDLRDYIDAFRRRRKAIFFVAAVVFVISAIIALLWPPTYRSTATILIEEQEIPQDLVRSTITSFASERIQTISQTVMTRANLLRIIDKYDLYHKQRRYNTTEDILDRMRKDINMDMINADVIDPRTGRPTAATIAFSVSYDGEGPGVTQKVANELTTLYLNENVKKREEKASETYDFLSTEADRLKSHISDLEAKLATFKEKNAGRLPELVGLNMQLRERTEGELRDVEGQLRALDDRKFYLEGQLAQINPLNPIIGDNGQPVPDPVTRLKMLRSQYLSATAKYAPDHPDVVRLRREIDSLEKQTGSVNSSAEQAKELAKLRAELAAAREKYSPDHPDVIRLTKAVAAQEAALKQQPDPATEAAKQTPDNPAYITLQAQLEGIKTQRESLTAEHERLKAKLTEYEKRLAESPEVERNYAMLNRDYQSSVTRYQEIKAKQNEAQIGRELEKERKGERFSLIDPPQLPEQPVKPNRPAIIFLGLVLSIACGIGYAVIGESMDSSIHGARAAAGVLEAAPLSVIPYLRNDEDIARAKRIKKIVVLTVASSLVLFLALVHFFWTPLDVLWFRGLRKVDTVVGG
jgi:succinoglycan biosynthesis transport protein ExoP